ncbi:MAG: retroviral-like aspartic protease family protein [Firmicutes bacterium]|nr:retroviral-like aspartic protease family protein [Bacillota bacterium]
MSDVSIQVQINGEPSSGIVVGDVTYVIWTALSMLGTPFEHSGFGTFVIGGETVTGVVVDGNTYLPWNVLAPGITPVRIDGGWNFTTAPAAPPPLVATIQGAVQQDAFYFTVNVNGTSVPDMILDTGAFELTFNATVAQSLGLPNLGSEQIGGVGGTAEAYQSECSLVLGTQAFANVPCIVDPSFTDNGLFGLRFFVDNQLQLTLNPGTATLLIAQS